MVIVRKIDGLTLQVDPLVATPPPARPAPAML
jgi:hypothetical protein